ncbi:hypothetical protein TGMAS_283585 [Toxoplasma gondii MAS]|uniref:Uncharacterized protein n=1 Tax=Toxoplasma gondii MAS TaxID=943118 RepID=A0A086PX56_TOXGO|nr:hypothetical protein TGMAS_283585 [Toxoplasma gondii MAS]
MVRVLCPRAVCADGARVSVGPTAQIAQTSAENDSPPLLSDRMSSNMDLKSRSMSYSSSDSSRSTSLSS